MATTYVNSKDFWLKAMGVMHSTSTPPLINPTTGKPDKTHPFYSAYNALDSRRTNLQTGYSAVFGDSTSAYPGIDPYNTYNTRGEFGHITAFRGAYALPLLDELGIKTIGDFNNLINNLNSDTAGATMDSLLAAIDASTNPAYATPTAKHTAKVALFAIVSEVDAVSATLQARHTVVQDYNQEETRHAATASNVQTWKNNNIASLSATTQADIDDIIRDLNTITGIVHTNANRITGQVFNDQSVFDSTVLASRSTIDAGIAAQHETMYRTFAEVQTSTATPKPTVGTASMKIAKFYLEELQKPEDQRCWTGLRDALDPAGQAAFADAQAFVDGRIENFNKLKSTLEAFNALPTTFKDKYLGTAATLDMLAGGKRVLDLIAAEDPAVRALFGEVLDTEKFKDTDIATRLQAIEMELFRTQEEASINNADPTKPKVKMGAATELVVSILSSSRSRFRTEEDAAAFRAELLEDLKTTFPYIDEDRLAMVIEESQNYVRATSQVLSSFKLENLQNEFVLTPAEALRIESAPTYQVVGYLAEERFPIPAGATPQQIQEIQFQRLVFARETLKFSADEQSQETLLLLNEKLTTHVNDMLASGAITDIQNLNAGAVTAAVKEIAIDSSIAERNMVKSVAALKASGDPRTVGKSDQEIRRIIIDDAKAANPTFAAYSDAQITRMMIAGPSNDAVRNALRVEMYDELRASDPSLATISNDEAERILSQDEAARYMRSFEVNGQVKTAYGDYGFAEMELELETIKNFEFDQIERKFFGFTPCGNPDTAYYRSEASRFAAMCKPGGLAEYYLAKAAWKAKWNPQVQTQGQGGQGGNGGIHVEVNPVFNVTGGSVKGGDTTVTVIGGGHGGSGGGGHGGKKDPHITLKNKIKMLYIVQDAATVAIRDGGGSVKAGILKQNYMERAEEVLELAKSMGLSDAELQAICADAHKKYCSHQVSKVKIAGGSEVKLDGVPKYQTDPTSDMITLKMDPSTGEPVMNQGVIEMTLDPSGNPTMSFDPTVSTIHTDATICQNAMMTQDDFIDGIVPDADKPTFEAAADTELKKKAQEIGKDATKIAEEGQSAV